MKNLYFLRSCLAVAALATAFTAFAGDSSNFRHDTFVAGVRDDAQALSRYTRHFGMDEEATLAYLDGLRAGQLQKGGTYVVYTTDANGLEKHTEALPAGEPVLFDTTGVPVLLASTGAPIEPAVKPVDVLASDAPAAAVSAATVPATGTGDTTWLSLATLIPPSFIFMTGNGGGGGTQSAPEPATLAVLALGGAGILRRRRKA